MEVQNVDLDILVTNTVSYKIIINQFQFFFSTMKNDCANFESLKANT